MIFNLYFINALDYFIMINNCLKNYDNKVSLPQSINYDKNLIKNT
jgi:hypothetical protein